MKNCNNIAVAFFIFTLLGCGLAYTEDQKKTGYDIDSPDVSFILPDTLREISGITIIDSASFACIQDENGILFIYDAEKNEIKSQQKFNKDGDYEELARVDKKIYILRSDGVLYKISDYTSPKFKLTEYETGIPADNNEGLCYDKDNNRLLIGCKGKIGEESKDKDKRAIYAFDLETNKLSKKPLFKFDIDQIKQFISEHDITVPLKQKKGKKMDDPKVKFMTSAISIHPLTKKLYLLSAVDHLLFIFDLNGTLEHIEPLDPVIFNKAEGITFFENGDMLISNEGQDKKPTLLRFRYGK